MAAAAPSAPDANAANELELARLASLPGIDVAQGLLALRGKTARYLGLLRQFILRHADDMDTLQTCLANGKRSEAAALAHALKGAAATLGARRIAEVAGELELTAKNAAIGDSAVPPCLQAIRSEFTAIAAVLPPAPVERPTEPAVPADPGKFKKVLNVLETALAQGDLSAAELLDEHKDLLRAGLGSDFESLARLVAEFDFEQAQASLHALRR